MTGVGIELSQTLSGQLKICSPLVYIQCGIIVLVIIVCSDDALQWLLVG